MISANPSVAVIHEPFSLLHRPGILDVRFESWFPYVCSENTDRLVPSIRDMLEFRYRPLTEAMAVRSVKDVGRLGRDWSRTTWHRRTGRRPLMRDPIAFFSAGWLEDTFDMDVVALIRHPAGFALSLKRLGWTHPFEHFCDQPLLLRDHLLPFEKEIVAAARHPLPVLDQAILLWRLIHHVMLEYRRTRPTWSFYRLEDLACDPVSSFREIYRRLDLSFDERAEGAILEHSDPSNPLESLDPSDVKRDSRASVWLWRDRLTPREIEHIRDKVEDISKEFYSDAEW